MLVDEVLCNKCLEKRIQELESETQINKAA